MKSGDYALAETRTTVVVMSLVVLAGPILGAVWWLVAPRPQLRVEQGAVLLAESSGESAVAADGWFVICAATAGLACALVAFSRIRRARIGALAGLTLGGVAAALLAWGVGLLLDASAVSLEAARALPDGTRLQGPLELSAKGVLLAWPMASVIAYFALAAGLEPPPDRLPAGQPAPDPTHRPRGTRFPVTVLRPGYAIDDVDRFFARVEGGVFGAAQARAVRFNLVHLGPRYDEVAVDSAIEELARAPVSPGPDRSQRRWPW
ncbi:MAG: hypothetical protein ACRDV1_10625 [Actinomycetes bacterium]